MKFPLQLLILTFIVFLPIISRHMLHWFPIDLVFLLVLFRLNWRMYLMHLL